MRPNMRQTLLPSSQAQRITTRTRVICQYIYKHIRTTAYQLLESREDQLRSRERLAQVISQRVAERDSVVSQIGLTITLPHGQTKVIRPGLITLVPLVRAPHHHLTVRHGDPIVGILTAGINDNRPQPFLKYARLNSCISLSCCIFSP